MKTVQFFKEIFLEYKLRIAALLIYTFICGYIFPYASKLIPQIYNLKAQLALITIIILNFTFEYIKELIIYPIYNSIIYKIKVNTTLNLRNQSIYDIKSGAINARFQRAYSNKFILRSFFKAFKDIVSMCTTVMFFFKHSLNSGIIITGWLMCYITLFIIIQKYNKKARNTSWAQTETSAQEQQQIIENPQNFDYNALTPLKNEFYKWNEYYFQYNIMFASLAIFSAFIIVFAILTQHIAFAILAWQMESIIKNCTNNIKIFYNSYLDLEIFFQETECLNNKYENSKRLKLIELSIQKKKTFIGKINFEMQERVISIQGKNGTGKTALALAIANLIKFQGQIKAPKTLYINSNSKEATAKQISTGEYIMQLVQKAKNSTYELIIFDEAIDVLTYENRIKAMNMLNNKQIIIISHIQEVLKLAQKNYELTSNLELKEFI